MKTFVGIDLGSTTTKAVLLDENSEVIGRGITNSRSNYATAARVASEEARVDGRFTLFRRALSAGGGKSSELDEFLAALERAFRLEQFLEQLGDLEETCRGQVKGERFAKVESGVTGRDRRGVHAACARRRPSLYAPGAKRKSDFFRDIAGSRYHAHAEEVARERRPALRAAAQRLRQVDHRRGEPAAVGRLERQVPPRARPRPRRRWRDPDRVDRRAADDREHARHRSRGDLPGRHRLRPRHAAVLQGAHPLGDPLSRPRRAHDVPEDAHRARHRRPGHQGHPGRPQRHRRELPDERPLCGRLRALSRLHRRRDEHGPARARAAGDEIRPAGAHQLDLHGVRRRRAARPAVARREARGHPGRAAPRHHPAGDLDHLALGRRHRRVHLHRRRGQERGGRARAAASSSRRTTATSPSTSTRSRSTPARSARPSSRAARITDRRTESAA